MAWWYPMCRSLKLLCHLQGKTTLCQCLLSVPGSDLKLHDGTATSHQQFLEDPESLCSTVSWEDNIDKVKWVYKVQDTPGTCLLYLGKFLTRKCVQCLQGR